MTEISTGSDPLGIASGSDGNLWFVMSNVSALDSIGPTSHQINAYQYTTISDAAANDITPDGGGNLWFTQLQGDQVSEFDSTTGIITQYALPTPKSGPEGIALGPDGNLWFTEFGVPDDGDAIGWINPSNGMIGQQAVNTAKSGPASIVYDPSDGDLWFTEFDADKIGMINPTTKTVTEFNVPSANADPGGIAVNANGNIWFTERSTNKIGELSPDDPNQITEYDVDGEPFGITAGPDGNIWITEDTSVWSVDVINPSNGSTIHSYHLTTGVRAIVSKIIVGPDGNLWFNAPDLYGTGISPGYIGSITTDGAITEYPVPDANPEGITAGKDGDIWFTASGSYNSTTGTSYPNVIGVITLSSASIPTQLGVTAEIPGSVTAGDGFGLAVLVENSLGNPTIDYNGTLTIALHNNPGHDTLGGTLTATVNNGVAVFSGLTLKDAAQGVTITATAAGLTSVTTPPFNVTLGATQLVVTTEPPQPPGSVADGTTFRIVVSAEDGLGNVNTSYDGPITLTLATNPGDATLGGTLQIGATNGIATFSDLTLNEIGDGYTILAAATGLSSATTAGVDVTAPPATHLVLATPPPGELTAGTGFGLVVNAEDDQGLIDPTYKSTVTIALAGGPTGASLGGTVTVTANQGVATFSGLTLDTAGTGYTLQLSSGSLAGVASDSILVDPGAAASFVVTTSFSDPDVAGTAATVTVMAYDANHNLVSSGPNPYEGTVDFSSTDGQVAGLPANYTFTAADAGSHEFTGVILETAGSQTITATDSANETIAGTSPVVTVNAAAASRLFLAQQPSPTATAGVDFTIQPVAEEEDKYGNVITSDSTHTVTASRGDTGTAVLQGSNLTVTFANGVATFSGLSYDKAETMDIGFSTDATAVSSTTSRTIVVSPAMASQVAITGAPLTLLAGGRGQITLQFVDTFGNPGATSTSDQTIGLSTTSTTGAFYAIQGSTSSITSFDIPAGRSSASFYYGDTKAATPTVTAADNAFHSSPEQQETVNAAAAQALAVATSFANPEVAGTAGTVTVTATDLYGNITGSGPNQYVGTVNLGSTDIHAAGLPASYTFTVADAGSHTFTGVALETSGSPTITATDVATGTITGSATVDVVPATVQGFAVTTSFANPDVAGTAGTVTVTAMDHYGNVVGSGPDQYVGTVNLGSTDAQAASLPASHRFTATDAGSYTFTGVIPKTAGSQTIGATDSMISTMTGGATVNVIPAAGVHLAMTSPELSLIAGSRGQVTVQFEDVYGNPGATSTIAQTINLSTSSTAGLLYATQSSTIPITSVIIAAGESIASFSYGDTQAGTPTLTATDTALSSSPTQMETVNPAATDGFMVTTSFASPDLAGMVGTITITAMDKYGNVVEGGPNQYEGTVDLISTDSQATGLPASLTFTSADAGSYTFTNVVLKTAGSQTIGAADSVTSSIKESTTVNVTPSAASQLVFTIPPPSSVTAGQAFTVVVAAEDPFHNVDTSFNGDVTIALPGKSGVTDTVQAQHGVATFVGLELDPSASGDAIQAAGGGLNAAATVPITVTTPNSPTPTPTSTPPTITGEQVVMKRNLNKKGKPVGKAMLLGFTLDYNTAMDSATAGLVNNYQVTSTSTRRVKKQTVPVQTPVRVTKAVYNPSTHSVTLYIQGNPKFAKGGEITVIYSPPGGVSSEGKVPLDASDSEFTILRKASGINLG